eukprot:CAMPEP_0113299082 /NCGR_PEP_ID=MMETSP0010_2-20120614/1259_1 /TAXON_ID=216773 ORGANISM="Corethron hystrix, Strain 308" /NCGR_SAMPLE_ID=MMETSP0010_2 /ASSEMBLY_ACC=CAM_ASM_000155 /LENGTH=348 /DNA_ID=CAMNT_0000152245 /DNA_START=16 /DNA_END=1063 /DNA_ORIENTATION=+ /assembly_acc=CAM_ASM_000155
MIDKPNSSPDDSPPSAFQVWATAARPHTLTASISPVIVGHSLASVLSFATATPLLPSTHSLLLLSIRFAAFACLIQLGTNLHNDYADFVRGADTKDRLGQARATQRGWLTPYQTAAAATACLVAALAIGTGLSRVVALAVSASLDVPIMLIVISSAFNAVAYTGGPYPLGYIGLENLSIGYSGMGEVFVFLYFGVVATATVPYMHLKMMSPDATSVITSAPFRASLAAALPIGLLATSIIVVNNLRDRCTDVLANKRTTAVRFGEKFARSEYALCVIGSYLCIMPFIAVYGIGWALPLLSLPLAVPEIRAVALGEKDGAALNAHVGGAAKVQAVFSVLLAIGIQFPIT